MERYKLLWPDRPPSRIRDQGIYDTASKDIKREHNINRKYNGGSFAIFAHVIGRVSQFNILINFMLPSIKLKNKFHGLSDFGLSPNLNGNHNVNHANKNHALPDPSCYSSMPFPRTGIKISPTSLTRSTALKIVKSFIFSPFFTSSQCNGMDTVAPGLGRNE